MGFAELLLIAVGLSMDAMAVSVCKGLSVRKLQVKHALLAGLYFGGFQFLMPVMGWLLGYRFEAMIKSVDHWIAFVLLVLIGLNMLRESFSSEEELDSDFGFLEVRILPAAGLIGVTTFLLSALGVWVGHVFGQRFRSSAERLGGVILIGIGVKILLEHLGILNV